MRILILTFTFPPNADGVSEASWAMAKHLADSGHEVIVGTEFLLTRKTLEPHPGIRIQQFKIEGHANLRIGIRGECEIFKEFLIEADADYLICHCWDVWPTTLAQLVFPKLRARKILVSHGYATHLWYPTSKFPWGLSYWAASQHLTLSLPLTMRRYDHLVFLSHKRDMGRFFDHLIADLTGFPNYSIIPNGTNPGEFVYSVEDFRMQHDIGNGIFFLCVANYSERKNQEFALRAFRSLRRPNSTLVFIGSEFSDYSRSLIRMDMQLQVRDGTDGRVLFLEKVSREKVIAAYLGCDIFVLSAKVETQPIVLIEAMACGKPFISTNTGCVSELPGGLTVSSEREMTLRMAELADSSKLRQEFGDNGRTECIKHYTWEKTFTEFKCILNKYPPLPHSLVA